MFINNIIYRAETYTFEKSVEMHKHIYVYIYVDIKI